MSRVVLEAASSTPLERTTVHNQFDNRAFGFRMLTKTVPITLYITPPGGYKKVVLVFGQKVQSHVPYKDLGLVDLCCRKVYTFNIKHYIKCFVPNNPNGAYTWNKCSICGASITDGTGKHSVQQMSRRKYRKNRYIYRSNKTIQSAKNQEVFTPQEGLPRC